jgi:uncharacterized repeat protein (TIGR03803 family)
MVALTSVFLLMSFATSQSAQGQTYKALFSFDGTNGANPVAGLIQDSAGNFYGTTAFGGASGHGTVFQLDKAGKLTVLYTFTGGADGSDPLSGLLRDSAGNLYGTTCCGGAYSQGVVFKLDTSGTETVLYSFTGGADGGYPAGTLLQDSAGNLYGTTFYGGSSGTNCIAEMCGTVFKLDTTGKETVMHSFKGAPDDGSNPDCGLIRDPAGNLYGYTEAGGGTISCESSNNYGCGVVFKVAPSGKEMVLHSFSGGTDGADPVYGSLAADNKGNIYGMTAWGGSGGCSPHGCGIVYKVDKAGAETVLYTFSGGADGSEPYAGPVLDAQGNLYGTTAIGGAYGTGAIFELDTAGNETVLYSFTGGSDGSEPLSGLIRNGAGTLYGTAYQGGADGAGVLFGLKP